MKVTYESKIYSPGKVTSRFVRASLIGDDYCWCEVDSGGYTLRSGDVDGAALPADVRQAADALRLMWPNYVRWPNAELDDREDKGHDCGEDTCCCLIE